METQICVHFKPRLSAAVQRKLKSEQVQTEICLAATHTRKRSDPGEERVQPSERICPRKGTFSCWADWRKSSWRTSFVFYGWNAAWITRKAVDWCRTDYLVWTFIESRIEHWNVRYEQFSVESSLRAIYRNCVWEEPPKDCTRFTFEEVLCSSK